MHKRSSFHPTNNPGVSHSGSQWLDDLHIFPDKWLYSCAPCDSHIYNCVCIYNFVYIYIYIVTSGTLFILQRNKTTAFLVKLAYHHCAVYCSVSCQWICSFVASYACMCRQWRNIYNTNGSSLTYSCMTLKRNSRRDICINMNMWS